MSNAEHISDILSVELSKIETADSSWYWDCTQAPEHRVSADVLWYQKYKINFNFIFVFCFKEAKK